MASRGLEVPMSLVEVTGQSWPPLHAGILGSVCGGHVALLYRWLLASIAVLKAPNCVVKLQKTVFFLCKQETQSSPSERAGMPAAILAVC